MEMSKAAGGRPARTARAIVLFDTRYGNTEKVARALARGMEAAGVGTVCSNIAVADLSSLSEFDLIAVGGPTHYRTASDPMKKFLSSIDAIKLKGRLGFAFDTRKESFWAGSAAKYIEERLRSKGMKMIWPTLSAWVFIPEGAGEGDPALDKDELKEMKRRQVRLAEKMEELFERTGGEIGRALINQP
jgi:flavodoxin